MKVRKDCTFKLTERHARGLELAKKATHYSTSEIMEVLIEQGLRAFVEEAMRFRSEKHQQFEEAWEKHMKEMEAENAED